MFIHTSNSDDVSLLIATARQGGSEAMHAAARLWLRGAEVLPAVVEEVNAGAERPAPLLLVIAQMRDPAALPHLLRLAHDGSSPACIPAFQALAHYNDPAVLPALLNATESFVTRPLAIEAMGESGDSRAMAPLRERAIALLGSMGDPTAVHNAAHHAQAEESGEELVEAIHIAVALARLGDHVLAPAVYWLMTAANDVLGSDGWLVRLEASMALKYLVGPGLLPAVRKAMAEESHEVRENAIRTAQLLGVKQIIPALIELVFHPVEVTRGLALSSMEKVLGALDPQALASKASLYEWWHGMEPNLTASVSYRKGKPVLPSSIFPELEHAPSRYWPNQELRIITGIDFGGVIDLEEIAGGRTPMQRAWAWWEHNQGRFQPGVLYKYGHQQNCDV